MSPTNTSYQHELATKSERLSSMLSSFEAPAPTVYPSAPEHYRLRAEFRVWHETDDSFYIMFEPGNSNQRYRVDQLPVASLLINHLMVQLRDAFMSTPILRHRLYQVEFLTTLSGEALITLIYRRPLDDEWTGAATNLEAALNARIIGRSRKQRIVISEDYVTERLDIQGRELIYRQPEGSFVQPNGEMNRNMLGWAIDSCRDVDGDLIELYCGLGNFSVALAPYFDSVLVTEINKTAIAAADFNLRINSITNTTVARLSAEEASQALSREREFNRLKGFDLDQFNPSTLLVDPPRAGLDAFTRTFAKRFKRLIYVSCNPETLCRDLDELNADYRITRVALFDQFPMTPHIESGVLLEKR